MAALVRVHADGGARGRAVGGLEGTLQRLRVLRGHHVGVHLGRGDVLRVLRGVVIPVDLELGHPVSGKHV